MNQKRKRHSYRQGQQQQRCFGTTAAIVAFVVVVEFLIGITSVVAVVVTEAGTTGTSTASNNNNNEQHVRQRAATTSTSTTNHRQQRQRRLQLLQQQPSQQQPRFLKIEEDDLIALANIASTKEEMNHVVTTALELQQEEVPADAIVVEPKAALSMEDLNHLFNIIHDPKSVNTKTQTQTQTQPIQQQTPPQQQTPQQQQQQQQQQQVAPEQQQQQQTTSAAQGSKPTGTTITNEQDMTSLLSRSLDNEYSNIKNKVCDPMPIPHVGNTSKELRMEYRRYFRNQVIQYEHNDAPGTLITDSNQIITTIGTQNTGNFVLWGYSKKDRQPILEMSAYVDNGDETTGNSYFELPKEAQVGHTSRDHGMRFVNPFDTSDVTRRPLSEFPTTNIIEVYGDHLVIMDRFYDVFAHFFLDFIPYLSYLKETYPNIKFLMADTKGRSKSRIDELDKSLNERITWLECQGECRNLLIKVRGNGLLKIFHPISNTRHIDLLLSARRWIISKHPPKLKSLQERTVVYYTRNNASAMHGRAMDIEQEQIMLRLIQKTLDEFNRPEKLVILDGTQSFDQQIDYFQSANFIIGAHGGGMANLLFTLPPTMLNENESADENSLYCTNRPKVLEFLCNPLTPDVQPGSWYKTYYNLYTTSPWLEYHNVLYKPPSDGSTTYIDIGEFHQALKIMFDDHGRPSPSTTSVETSTTTATTTTTPVTTPQVLV